MANPIKVTLPAFDHSNAFCRWAKHRRQKAAAKMYTALNMRSFLPNFVIVKSARNSDPKSARELFADMKAGEVAGFETRRMSTSSI